MTAATAAKTWSWTAGAQARRVAAMDARTLGVDLAYGFAYVLAGFFGPGMEPSRSVGLVVGPFFMLALVLLYFAVRLCGPEGEDKTAMYYANLPRRRATTYWVHAAFLVSYALAMEAVILIGVEIHTALRPGQTLTVAPYSFVLPYFAIAFFMWGAHRKRTVFIEASALIAATVAVAWIAIADYVARDHVGARVGPRDNRASLARSLAVDKDSGGRMAMTRSTKLLSRLIHVELVVGTCVMLALGLLLGACRPPEGFWIAFLVTAGLLLGRMIASVLDRVMFPVTDRQSAWLPLAACGGVALGGAVAALAVQTHLIAMNGGGLSEMSRLWRTATQHLSFVSFLLLLFWRISGTPGAAIGFIGLLFLFQFDSNHRGAVPHWVEEHFVIWWALWALGCAFLIWEAPFQTAVLRRTNYQPAGSGPWGKSRVPESNGPTHPSWATNVADALSALVALTIVVWFCRGLFADPIGSVRRNHFLLLLLIALAAPIRLLVECRRANQASGIGPRRGLGVLLVEATIVGYPFRNRLGVKRGALVRCGFCDGWRMAWEAECPSCHARALDAKKPSGEQPAGIPATIWPKHDPGALFFRGIAPFYVLGLVVFLNWSRWFGG
jgi:hypothetical protein